MDATALAILTAAEARGIAGRVTFTVENLAAERVREQVRGLCGRLSLDYESLALPLVVVDGNHPFQGADAVERAVASVRGGQSSASTGAAALSGPHYFYSELCADCVRTAPLLGKTAMEKHDIDTAEGAEAFARLRREYGDRDITVPALLWEGALYLGSGEIGALLERIG